MLLSIKLENFLSHEYTEISFVDGTNVFIGKNGSGKSSIIDAITYALYGKHDRGKNVNIVRNNTNGGSVTLRFRIGDKEYEIYKRFDREGSLETATIKCNGKLLAAGGIPRKGVKEEGVTSQVRSILGLDYEDIKIATIIKQGELDSIIELKPKEIRELINRLIGLDSFDKAYEEFKEILDDFKERLRKEIGYGIEDLDRLELELKNSYEEKEKVSRELEGLKLELKNKELEKERLEKEKNALEVLRSKKEMYEEKRKKLLDYLRTKRLEYKKKVNELEEQIRKYKSYIENVNNKERIEEDYKRLRTKVDELNRFKEIKKNIHELESKIRDKESFLEDIRKKLEIYKSVEPVNYTLNELEDMLKALDNKINSIIEDINNLSNLIGKIESKKNDYESIITKKVCPTCDRPVSSQEFYDKIKSKEQELKEKQSKLEELKRVKEDLIKEKKDKEVLREKRRRYEETINELRVLNELYYKYKKEYEDYKSLLEEYEKEEKVYNDTLKGIDEQNLKNELDLLEKRLNEIRKEEAILNEYNIRSMEDIKRLEFEVNDIKNKLSLIEKMDSIDIDSLAIDDFTKRMIEEINILKKEIVNYKEEFYNSIRLAFNNVEKDIRELNQRIGRSSARLEMLEDTINKLERAKSALEHALKYVRFYEQIREDIYHRVLPMRLREWVFKELSIKASEYISMFDVGISHIIIKEEKNDVIIRCYNASNEIDVDSISGGEKVAISLALRFAIANIRSKGVTDFIILDEPTIHLDQDRKRVLVELISKLAGYKGILRQIIMITHDSEIFEDAKIDNILRFEKRGGISKVVVEN